MSRRCPVCHTRFGAASRFCDRDGTPLQEMSGWAPAAEPGLVLPAGGRTFRLTARLTDRERVQVWSALRDDTGGVTHLLIPDHAPRAGEAWWRDAEQVFRRLAMVRDPAILSPHNLWTDDDGRPVAEIFLGGSSPWRPLAALQQTGDPRLAQRVFVESLLLRALRGLMDLHGRGQFHGTLIAENLWVQDGDFAVSLLAGAWEHGVRTAWYERLGDDSDILPAPPRHLAPEILRGAESGSAPADLWAFGLLAWRALSGEEAYPGSAVQAMAAAAAGAAPVSFTPLWPDLAQEWTALLTLWLAADPQQRPLAREALDRLEGARQQIPARLRPTDPPGFHAPVPAPSPHPPPFPPPGPPPRPAPRRDTWPPTRPLPEPDPFADFGERDSPPPPEKEMLAAGALYADRFRIRKVGPPHPLWRVLEAESRNNVPLRVVRVAPHAGMDVAFDPSRLLADAPRLMRLKSPAIAPLVDMGMDRDGAAYLVWEHTPYPDALSLTIPVAPEKIARLGSAIAAGLADGHEQGFLHGDLVATRVGLSNPFTLRVVLQDFGLVPLIATALQDKGLLGSAGAVPPERMNAPEGAIPDPRWDLYALGSLLHHAACGYLPQNLPTPPVRPSDPRIPAPPFIPPPAIPSHLKERLDQLLAPDPDRRLLSADSAREMFEDYQRFLAGPPNPPPPPH